LNRLILENIRKVYPGGVLAVDGVSLEIEEGECLAIAGPSGSGKTTLLRMIAGFETPTSGQMRLGTGVIFDAQRSVPPETRGIGMVFQEGALFPHLNVQHNIEFGLSSWPREKRRERVRELLELVGMPEYEGRYPHELSGGQQQRVALARSLAPRPSLLLLDEPFSSVDEMFREQLRRDLISILQRTGTTTVLVTHDTEDALAASRRIAVMHAGRLLQVDSPEEIYNRPRSRVVAEFFGRINVFKATSTGAGLCTPFGVIPVQTDLPAGREVDAAIRPENVFLNPAGALSGVVERVTFLGRQTEIVLRSVSLAARTSGKASQQEASDDSFVMLVTGEQPPKIHQNVQFDVRPNTLLTF
jgi:iron(III) transport system ATP-binding protein